MLWENLFCSQKWENGEMGQKWPEIGCFEFKEKIVINFHYIYSILKIFIFIWEKCCFA